MSTPSSMVGEQNSSGSSPSRKARLAFLAILRRHLGGMFSCFENAIQIDEAAIALDEVAVHLRGQSALVEQAGPLPTGRSSPSPGSQRRASALSW